MCFFYHVSEAYIGEAERKMQLAADPESCAYEEDTEIGAELEKRPLLIRSESGDIHKLHEATGMTKGLLGMREA
jgi:hypothetical protein